MSFKRICLVEGKKIKQHFRSYFFKLTGGIAGLFHQFIDLAGLESDFGHFENRFFSSSNYQRIVPKLKKELEFDKELFEKLTTSHSRKLVKKFEFSRTDFLSIKLLSDPTAQEIKLIKLFKSKQNEPVSRDEIAETLWEKGWEDKYSDWAIDKLISRLRKKIVSSRYRIITIKNMGYQLVRWE